MGRGESGALLLIRGGDPLLLLLRNRRSGVWGLPGGRLEPSEDARLAALRELREETGIVDVTFVDAIEPFIVTRTLRQRGRVLRSKRTTIFVARTATTEVRLSEEYSEFGWFHPEEAQNLLPEPLRSLPSVVAAMAASQA